MEKLKAKKESYLSVGADVRHIKGESDVPCYRIEIRAVDGDYKLEDDIEATAIKIIGDSEMISLNDGCGPANSVRLRCIVVEYNPFIKKEKPKRGYLGC